MQGSSHHAHRKPTKSWLSLQLVPGNATHSCDANISLSVSGQTGPGLQLKQYHHVWLTLNPHMDIR